MNNLEKLEQAIYNALPRLKDDVVGQRYERHGEIYTCLFINDSGKKEPFFYLYNTTITTWYLQEIQTRFDVLGQEIALNDVLQWLKIKGIQIRDTTDHNLLYFGYFKNNGYWNLEYNLLKDQSTELINYLTELI